MLQIDRKKLMQYIEEVSFAMDDLILYLDTHPKDQNALNYYEKLRVLRQQAVNSYTDNFGPLTFRNVKNCNDWAWVNQPWPWEMEG